MPGRTDGSSASRLSGASASAVCCAATVRSAKSFQPSSTHEPSLPHIGQRVGALRVLAP